MYKSNNLGRGDLDPRDKSRFALGPPISEGFCSVISYHDAKDWEHSWGGGGGVGGTIMYLRLQKNVMQFNNIRYRITVNF